MKFNHFVNNCTKFGFAFVLAMLIFVVLFLFYPSYSWAAPTTDSMLGYWKFDNNGTDSSNDGNTATNFGATYLTDKVITNFPNEGSVSFPSLSSHLQIANQPGVTPTNTLTFSMWLKLNATSADGPIAGNYNDIAPNQGFGFFFSGSDIVFRVGGDSVSLPMTINNITVGGDWVHLVGVWDGSSIRLYLNGVEKAAISHTQTVDYASTSFILGKFLGKLDDVRLYNRALSPMEINDLALGKHTSATWTGSTNTDYENTSNWSPNVIPDPYTIINIPNTTNKPQFTQSESVGGINILTGSELRISGFNLILNDSSVDVGSGQPKNFDNQGSLYINNIPTQVINGFNNDTNSGTVVVNGDPSGSELLTGSQYYNLTINITGGTSIKTLPAALLVHGNLTCNVGALDLMAGGTVKGNIYLNGGTLNNSGSNVIYLYGSWSSISGSSFSSGTGTVELKGTDQTIMGPNNFFNLVKNSTASNTLFFDSTSTQSVSGILSLHGAASQLLNLRSTADGTQWRINSTGTLDISYLDVKDSLSNTVSIDAIGKNIIDSGNNFNWLFNIDPPIISIGTTTTSTNNPLFSITGYAEDLNFLKEVLFSVDSIIDWHPCAADDGSFNGANEAFTCTPVTNLTSGSHTYYIKAIDIYDNITPTYAEWTFVLDNVPPAISTLGSTSSTTSTTITWTTNENADSGVEYGLTTGYGSSVQDNNYIQSHSIDISSLTTCTTYHYRVKSKDALNNIAIGTDQTFTTLGCGVSADTTPPVISNISAVVGNNDTTIGWVTDEDATSVVEYGLTSSYGSIIEQSNNFNQSHSIFIPNLTVCTTYHYLVRSRDDASNINSSTEQSFTTGGCTTTSTVSSCTKDAPDEPEITSIQVEDKDSIILKIDEASGEVDEYEIKYGKSTENYEWEIDEIDEDDIDSYTIDELSPDTTYYFKVRAINECEKGDWSDAESAKTEKEEVLTNYLADNTPTLTAPKTPVIENVIEPIVEVTSTEDNGSTSENSPYFRADEEINEDDEKDEEFEDAKESKAPVIEECGSTSIEMIESLGRKKLKLEGFGPPNTALTVYVYSDDPVVLSVKTDSNGDWSYVLEDNLEDGEHQVYVAITEESGRIKGKSNPLVFVKTAQAVSVISNQSVSPTQKAKSNFMVLSIVLSIAAIFLALAIIGWRFRVQKTDEKNFG